MILLRTALALDNRRDLPQRERLVDADEVREAKESLGQLQQPRRHNRRDARHRPLTTAAAAR
eukprot:COSAG04_NODE_174_length_21563_cov_12.377003_21_plen_62_part_00